jgi:TonB family protein
MKTMLLPASPAVLSASPSRAKPTAARRSLNYWEQFLEDEPASSLARSPGPRAAVENPGSWRYSTQKRSPLMLVLAVIITATVHGVVLFGFNRKEVVVEVRTDVESREVVFMEMPPLEELDEPEEVFDGDAPNEEIDPGQYVPMQADIPTFQTEAAFVQLVDYQSLLPKPDYDSAVLSIPKRISHSRIDQSKMKDLFNLADLDRVPEAVFQPAPVFPFRLKQVVQYAEVLVEFIVDSKGKVAWATVVDSTHRGFEDTAIVGVSRWQFRPGMKDGKRVNTRMRVPIRFRINGED